MNIYTFSELRSSSTSSNPPQTAHQLPSPLIGFCVCYTRELAHRVRKRERMEREKGANHSTETDGDLHQHSPPPALSSGSS